MLLNICAERATRPAATSQSSHGATGVEKSATARWTRSRRPLVQTSPIGLSIGPADAPASLAPATKACPAAATTQQWARRAALETRRPQCGWAVERFACKLLPARMLMQLLDDVVNACIASCEVNTAVAVS